MKQFISFGRFTYIYQEKGSAKQSQSLFLLYNFSLKTYATIAVNSISTKYSGATNLLIS